MKFTVKNLRAQHRSIPTQGNTAIPIGPLETIEIDYPFGAEGFFEKLTEYDYEVTKEASELDTKIRNRFKLMESLRPSGYDRYEEAKKKDNLNQPDNVTNTTDTVADNSTDNTQQDNNQSSTVQSYTVTGESFVEEEGTWDDTNESVQYTKEEILTLCRDLSAEQLRAILKEIGITSTSNNITTLVNKIDNSSATVEELNAAYDKVVNS